MIFNDRAINKVSLNGTPDVATFKYLEDAISLTSETSRRNWSIIVNNLLVTVDEFIKAAASGTINVVSKSDALVLTDALSRTLVLNRAQLELLLLTDGLAKFAFRVRQLGDNLLLLDEATKSKLRGMTAQDQFALLDSALAYKTRGRVQSDALTMADVLASALLRVRKMDDGVLLVDSFTKSVLLSNIFDKIFSDAMTLQDANVFRDWQVLMTDAKVLNDEALTSVLQANLKTKNLTDTLVLQSVNTLREQTFIVGDPIVLDESRTILRKGFLIKTVSDSLVLIDYAEVTRAKTLVEAIKLDDTQGRYAELAMIAEDDNVLADEIVKAITGGNLQSRTLTDTILLTSATLRRNYTVIADALASMSDSFTKSIVSSGVVNTKNLVDNLLLTSDSSWGRVIAALATDEIAAVTDAFTKAIDSGGLVNTKNLVDNLTLLDQRLQSKFVFAVKNDLLLVLDSVVTSRLIVRWLADTLRLVDSFASIVTGIKVKLLSDSIVLSDGVSEFRILYRALSEQIVLPDEFNKGGSKSLQLDDAVLISDSLQKVRFLSRQLQDVVNQLVDTKILERVISRVDSLTIADQRVSYVTRVRALADYLGFDEQVQRALTGRIEKTDTLVLTDEMIARFLPFLQYEVHLKLGVAAKEMTLGVDVVTKLGVDRKLMELAVA